MSEAGECCIIPENGTQTVADDQTSNEIGEGDVMEEKDVDAPNPEEQMGGDHVPTLDFPLLVDSRSSTPSEGNTPRDYDTSSGSPSPVPEDGSETPDRQQISLGRDISLMMKALNSLDSPEEKIAALCKTYADLLEQQKMKEKRMRGVERKAAQSAKAREQIQKELNKANLGKAKMESLARELNKQNKLLKEESYQLTLSHSKEREQISAKFQTAADEISGKINEIADRNELLSGQNRDMSEKIANLLKETSSREQMVKAVMDQRDLQEQILELKLKKAEEERDIALRDVESLKKEVTQAQTLCEGYLGQEKELRTQITFYSEKVSDFQSISDKSNKIFKTFRSEVDAMNGKMKALEKTTSTWKKNYEQSEAENRRVLAENMEQARKLNILNVKVTKLSDLSRALQTERNDLTKKVSSLQKKAHTVTVEATSTVEPSSQSQRQPMMEPSLPAQSSGRVSPDSSSQGEIPASSQQQVEPRQPPNPEDPPAPGAAPQSTEPLSLPPIPGSSQQEVEPQQPLTPETVQHNPDSPTLEDPPGTEPLTLPPMIPQSVPSVKAEADSTSEEARVSEATQARTSEAEVSSTTEELNY